ncbi:CoA-binding [Acididesulfobacillus acetoxydans]|uniref:Redox-sensing transcriptional repressor Rex n=1 Tax=Acididesulfobacillus acetoxydans TaxID=1561005 RepID=A0A8S0WPK4_9FIRM|nr:redox-sensing transcriptional repressor Rex [Acididesulfobacillus acetoxydans]CAA7601984.1 CoA-binding [Acididesulfobacillus acetoxydans]CEJ08172.1 Redox-sensing transcriptional repressor rex [Acididesulfobacillus acetoxydans]
MKLKIPEATIIRLSLYLRNLCEMERKGHVTISSEYLAKSLGIKSALVRKDLAYFGEFGTKGVGYDVKDLHAQILRIFGLNANWNVAIIGEPGLAVFLDNNFKKRGFVISSIFNLDPEKVGTVVNGVRIQAMDSLEATLKGKNTRLVILAVPAPVAQEIADKLVKAGIQAILNFVPVVLNVPPWVKLRNVDLVMHLEILTFCVGTQRVRLVESRGKRPWIGQA